MNSDRYVEVLRHRKCASCGTSWQAVVRKNDKGRPVLNIERTHETTCEYMKQKKVKK